MKKILLISIMVMMTVLSINAENTVEELVNDIEKLQRKIETNEPNSPYRVQTLETAKANIKVWKNRIKEKAYQIVELVADDGKDVEKIVIEFRPSFEYFSVSVLYADGTTTMELIETNDKYRSGVLILWFNDNKFAYEYSKAPLSRRHSKLF